MFINIQSFTSPWREYKFNLCLSLKVSNSDTGNKLKVSNSDTGNKLKVSNSDTGNELFKFPGCSHLLPGLIQDNNTMGVELLTTYKY